MEATLSHVARSISHYAPYLSMVIYTVQVPIGGASLPVSGEPFFGRGLDVEAANKSIDRESKPGDKLAYASIDMQNQQFPRNISINGEFPFSMWFPYLCQ